MIFKYYKKLRSMIRKFHEMYDAVCGMKILESAQIASVAAQSHQYLKKYQDLYNGKEIVIVACGPTAEFLEYDADKIYIGVNRAFKNSLIKFDYLFCQDQFDEGMEEIDCYSGNNCQKFYGILSTWHGRHIKHCKKIPWSSVKKAQANIYYLESVICHKWAYDISVEPFGEFRSTVFSALQFALYTHPKRIYLVGCDCSSGYFYDENDSHKYPHLIESWKDAANFISTVYPDIEIVSINPVELKGLFKDEYTQKYLDAHAA